MAYVGAQPNKQLTKTTSQSFNGTGSATAFTLNRAVNTGEELEVFVDNVQQEPGVGKSYTATGTTLTFDEAPPSGTGNVYVIYRGQAEVTTRLEAPDLSITTAKLAASAVTTAKIADDAVTSDKLAHDLTVQTSLSVPTIKDSSGSNTAMTINSSGIISTPARPAFYAYGDDGWTGLAAINTYYIGGFDHTEFNIGSHYNTSTKLFTVPVSGVYLFRSQVYFNDSGNPTVQIAFQQTSSGSTTLIAFTAQQQAGDGTIGITRIYNAVAGQQIGAYVYKSALTANTDYFLGINHSYFSGVFLG